MSVLVGREAETSAVGHVLAAAREGRSSVLVVRGEAGVGKSSLLDHAVGEADGFTVLRGVGVEVESELAYAALHQILRPVFDRIERLPGPQAAALRAAFALSNETVDERFRVSLGVLGLLSEVAEERPLLCLVDDAQWLDQASADALLFAARRLEAESIALVFAAREDDERQFVARGLPELHLGGLSAADSRSLLADHLGSAVATGVFDWLIDNANGNPLALVELPATLSAHELAGQAPLAGKLRPATSVEQMYLERSRTLPESTWFLLVLAAAEETGRRATVERAARELGFDVADLAAAERAGLVHVDAEQLAFRHPLVRSAIYRGASFTDRERAHRALATASAAEGSPDRAAWHRAAATVGPDEAVAHELEETAERAQLRSGHAAAASALERAAELSGHEEARARRLVAAADAGWQAGQPERATALLERAGPDVTEPVLRAELDDLRGVIMWRCGSLPDACATLLAGAEPIAQLDPRKALEMLADAGIAAWDAGDFGRLGAVAEAAEALPVIDDEVSSLLARILIGTVRLSLGDALPDGAPFTESIERAAELENPRLLVWAGIAAEVAGEDALESLILGRGVALARASGAVDRLTVALESSAVQGFLAGHWPGSSDASEGLQLATEAGLPNAANLHRATLAWIAAVEGREDECRAYAAETTSLSRPNGHGIASSIAEWAVALLDLGLGRPDEAVTRLQSLANGQPGASHPFYVLLSAPDLVEACVRTGRDDQAAAAFGVLDEFAQPGGPAWAHALAARCRALLADGDDAEQRFEDALELHGRCTNPFDRARTELLYGEFLRRARRRMDARDRLRSALEEFERLRAEPWAERARAELRATGETARKRDPSTIDELTPQELQIARLVGEGNSNKDVAAQLFLSPRTVEYHLRKVFAKLGISSRAELIRHAIVQPDAAAAA